MKQIKGTIFQAVSVTLVLLLICGLAFPLALSGLSALIFPSQAEGSLVYADGQAVGTAHVGQQFTEDYFMKGRPSAYNYNTYTVDEEGNEVYLDGSEYAGLSSGSNNYGASNPALAERVQADIDAFLESHPDVTVDQIPTDLMTASGSGLDPHISVASAKIQVPVIAEASGLSEEKLNEIIENNTTEKMLGVFGEQTVNVLGVNMEIALEMGLVQEISK